MIAKLVVHGHDRLTALRKLRYMLEQYEVAGLHTNIPFLIALASHPAFEAGEVETGFIQKFYSDLFPQPSLPSTLELAQAALFTRLQNNATIPIRNLSPWDLMPNKRFGGGSFHQTVSFSSEGGTASAQSTTPSLGNEAHVLVKNFDGQESQVEVMQSIISQNGQLDSVLGGERLRTTFVPSHKDMASIDMFTGGAQSEIILAKPNWVEQLDEIQGGGSSGALTAPTPSRVVAVMCSVDQEVKAGQTLVILEGELFFITVVLYLGVVHSNEDGNQADCICSWQDPICQL